MPRGRARRIDPPQMVQRRFAVARGGTIPSRQPAPRLLIAEHRCWAGEALADWLQHEGFDVAAYVMDERALQEALDVHVPDLALIDAELPSRGGLAASESVLSAAPGCQVIILAGSPADTAKGASTETATATTAGLFGWLTKDASPGLVLRWLQAALYGGEPPVDGPRPHAIPARGELTSRERQILDLLGEGANGRRIAAVLGISHHTVRTHIQNILVKLNVRSRLEAVALASTRGLLGSGEGPSLARQSVEHAPGLQTMS